MRPLRAQYPPLFVCVCACVGMLTLAAVKTDSVDPFMRSSCVWSGAKDGKIEPS